MNFRREIERFWHVMTYLSADRLVMGGSMMLFLMLAAYLAQTL